jgi:hypothetical protein
MIDDQTIDKVVHQLMNDWYDHNKDHKDLARWLIGNYYQTNQRNRQ